MTSTRWHKYNRVENIVDDAKAYQPIENTKKEEWNVTIEKELK